METSGADDERLEVISDRLSELDPDTFEFEARKILSGLGFCNKTVPMERMTKDMSGGWRMRVSLAKVMPLHPTPGTRTRDSSRPLTQNRVKLKLLILP